MLKILSPYDQSLIKEIPLDGKDAVNQTIKIAHDLFQDIPNWLPAYQRINILEKTIQLMKERKSELIEIAAKEGGKPYNDTIVEVDRAINGVKLAAEGISYIKGEQIPMELTKSSEGRIAFTSREPIGVVAAISAFNHPLNLIIHQTVTAIAVGCPIIIKPALTTPLSCLAFVEMLQEAGLPKGWCQAVICDNEDAQQLVTDKRINFFSFIGSAKVGWYLRSKLSPGTRCALEHGGVAPVIVEKDADFNEMIPALLKGGFYHAGQVCVSVQRVFVNEEIAEKLALLLAEGASNLIVGDQMNRNTEVGPLILPREVDRVEQWVNEAIEAGTKVLCGGKRISDSCYEPTVLFNPPMDSKVSTLEVFGPVVCVYSVKTNDEAILKANSLDVHFQASIFTKNLDVALSSVKKINATAVMVNDHTAFRVDWMPFGGRDSAGIGIGGIQYSMKEMTREKLMVIKTKSL